MTDQDCNTDTDFDFTFETDFDFGCGMVSGTPSEAEVAGDGGAPTTSTNDNRALASAWDAALQTTTQQIDAAGPRFARAVRRTANGRARVEAGLAPLALYAAERLGNARPQTLLGLAVTVEADTLDADVVAANGDVTPTSSVFRVMEFLLDYKASGVAAPHEHFARFIEDREVATLWPLLRMAVGDRPASAAPSGGSEHSALNFEVPIQPASNRPLPQVLADLDTLVGLTGIKRVLTDFAATESVGRLRREAGLPVAQQSRHMMFTGNSGTGKTTVARLVADVLKATGSMSDAHLVEVDRSMLIGEWLGSSALKTRKVTDSALGGVLFIDEAYSLAGTTDSPADRFAQEALDTLVKVMEDDRDDLVVILAGYPEPMERLLQMNPGLASRIGITVAFPDFSSDDLVSIFTALAESNEYDLAPDALSPIEKALGTAVRTERFGNARVARSLFEACTRAHAVRIMDQHPQATSTDLAAELRTLRLADTLAAVRSLALRPTVSGGGPG